MFSGSIEMEYTGNCSCLSIGLAGFDQEDSAVYGLIVVKEFVCTQMGLL